MSFLKSLYVGAVHPNSSDIEAALRTDGTARLLVQLELLKTRLKIAVVYGGDKSAEGAVINQRANQRPWKSYKSVAEDIAGALGRLGFRFVDLIPEDMQLGERIRSKGIHMAWLNTGGVQGRNPMVHAASMLEMLGVSYVGHDPLTAGILDNKHVFKREMRALGLPTAPFIVSYCGDAPFLPESDENFQLTFGAYDGPFIIKPTTGRASLNVHFVQSRADLADVVSETKRETDTHVLIEKFMSGREYCVAVCGPVTASGGELIRHGEPFVFSATERLLDPGEHFFTSKDIRPIEASRFRQLTPSGDGEVLAGLEDLAKKVYRGLHLESIVRLDVRADASGELNLLEANPKPDLQQPSETRTSLVCGNLDAHGMSYDDLILSLISSQIDLEMNRNSSAATPLRFLLQAI